MLDEDVSVLSNSENKQDVEQCLSFVYSREKHFSNMPTRMVPIRSGQEVR